MDPLSITASIVAVLQATNAIISVCYDYRSAIRETPWGLTRITEEVKSLRAILETLEALANDAENEMLEKRSRMPTLQLLCIPDEGPLDLCRLELDALEKKLTLPSWSSKIGSKRRALIQALGWQLKDGDVNEILQNIGRFKTTLNLALTADEA